MARIYTYPNDAKLQDDDAWIGTNKIDLATVQFTAQKIADYLNFDGKVSINGQVGFKYEYGQLSAEKTMTQDTGPGNESFSNITELNVHQKDIGNQFVPNFLAVLVGSQILISEANNIDNFGHYTLLSYSANIVNPEFYTLTLAPLNSNGNLENLKVYYISSLNIGAGDKTFIFTQGASSATWSITHTLGKYPSVSVVDSGNNIVHADVIYNSTSSITLNFKAAFSGKAYLN